MHTIQCAEKRRIRHEDGKAEHPEFVNKADAAITRLPSRSELDLDHQPKAILL
jgi:hypothetical protein